MIGKIKGVKRRHRYRSMRNMKPKYSYYLAFRRNKYTIIKIPEFVDISNNKNRSLLIATISSLHKGIRDGYKNFYLDFNNTKRVIAPAMLLLFSEIRNIKNMLKNIKFRCKTPRNDRIDHVLMQIGIYKICNRKYIKKVNYDDVVHWRVCSGTLVVGKTFDEVIDPNDTLTLQR